MGAPPGWYPDPAMPPGHQRYWNGLMWTELRSAPPSPGVSGKSWFARHRFLTALFAVVVLLGGLSLLFDDEPDPQQAGGTSSEEPGSDSSGEPTDPRRDGGTTGNGADHGAEPGPPDTRGPTYLVAYVVDGDTVELANGETVRLVGIDTPEVGECGYEAAARRLEQLVLGEQVRLGMSDEDRDQYGRLLRYLDVGDIDAGLAMIQAGLAIARYDSRDGYGYHPREDRYIAADRASKDIGCPRPAPLVQMPPKGGGGCAPGYDPCVPPYPPDVDCADVDGPIYVTGSDPHGLDADGDGVACE